MLFYLFLVGGNMTDALNYLYYLFDSLISWIFNDAEFFPNVTIGWVIITCILFGMVIKSILNIPRGIRRTSIKSSTSNKD